MNSDAERFLHFSNPSAWLRSAEDLHEQALQIYPNRGRKLVIEIGADGQKHHQLDGVDRSLFLLCGFALENAVKGLVVFEKPNFVSGGRLNRSLLSHHTSKLLKEYVEADLSAHGHATLQLFGDAIISWARYPCRLSHERTGYPNEMSAAIWSEYLTLIMHLTTDLKSRLVKGWTGPFGFYGKFTFEDFE